MQDRNPLSTQDINGPQRVNRFGQKMQVPENVQPGMAAGELNLKQKQDSYGNQYEKVPQG